MEEEKRDYYVKEGSEYSNEHSGIDKLLKIITDFESQGEYFGTPST